MRELKKEELLPGMIVSEDVYAYASQLVIPKGAVLTDHIIARLLYYSILSVKIDEEKEDNIITCSGMEITQDEFYERIKSDSKFIEFKKDFEEEVDRFKIKINDIVEKNAPIESEKMLQTTLPLLQKCTSINIFDMLRNMQTYDDTTYAHSVNVGLISNVIATWLGFSEEEIKMATLCGLLHDIGKVKISPNIIKKAGKLTTEEYSIIKSHSMEGYEILKRHNIDQRILNTALMHHEKCDGTGYPKGLLADKIDDYAKLVSIADVYDAMTSARIYRGAMCPFEVIDIFESEGLNKYKTKYILTFLDHVANSYINESVRLSNGMRGKIIFINTEKRSRPTVNCNEKIIDLIKEKTLFIEAII